MSPIIESPIPQPPAEQREPLVIPFDLDAPLANYPNALYEFVHLLSQSKRSDMGVTPMLSDRRPCSVLVLLERPVLGVSTSCPYQITFCAAILDQRGAYTDGWLISTHEAALMVWNQ